MNENDERVRLDPLDPASTDPGYWGRFHTAVLERSADELRRRQLAGEIGIAQIVFQWRKALVPVTLLAAAVAGMFIAGNDEPASGFVPLALEEALWEDLDGDPIPAFLERGADIDGLAHLASAGGF